MENGSEVFGAIIGVTMFCFLYFLPAVNAKFRSHHNTKAIFAFNLFLGWTFLGWVIALVWSCTAVNTALVQKSTA